MIFWSTKTPDQKQKGKYLVCSDDGSGNMRVDIEYWDGMRWDNMDERNIPIKWVEIKM